MISFDCGFAMLLDGSLEACPSAAPFAVAGTTKQTASHW
jgi:hypothetical protein